MKERRKKLKKLIRPVTFLMDNRLHIQLLIKTKDMEISISDFVRQSVTEKIKKETTNK